MNRKAERTEGQEPEPFYVDEFRPEDAQGIVRLFRAVYGEGYPIRLFYDPEAIIAVNREGRYYSIVARTRSGEVVGVNNLVQTAPYHGVYENAAGLILKEYRGSGAMTATLDYLYNDFCPRNPRVEELFGEPVCNHVALQKGVIRFNCIETGIELALMPAEAYSQEKSAKGRVATLDVFRCYVPRPHRIFLPRAYEPILRWIYGRLDDARDICIADGILPADKQTRAELSVFDFARVSRMAVREAGHDFLARLHDLEGRARDQGAAVFQVSLNLTEPWVGQAVDILRAEGYFFGGALPRWFDGDGMLMQKLECPPDFENIVILSDFSKELLAFIREDRRQVHAGQL